MSSDASEPMKDYCPLMHEQPEGPWVMAPRTGPHEVGEPEPYPIADVFDLRDKANPDRNPGSHFVRVCRTCGIVYIQTDEMAQERAKKAADERLFHERLDACIELGPVLSPATPAPEQGSTPTENSQ
jgi:hypothetical protein